MGSGPLPARGNLVIECARVIRLRISGGEWCETLPGERSLATLLGVGRDTVRLAIQLLERENVLGPARTGSKRSIRIGPNHQVAPKTRHLRIGMLSPWRLEKLSQPMLFEVDHLRRALAARDGSLDLFAPGWYEQKTPAKRLAQLVKDEPCDAWILFRASARIQQWFEESGVPCLVRGYPQADLRLQHIDVNWEATARHAAGRLWRLGHRNVGILVPSDALAGVKAAIKGAGDLGEPDFRVIEIPENRTVDGLIQSLTRAFKLNDPPTAVIATRPRQAATTISWLASQGVRVPAQFSVITLAHEPFLDHLVPAVSGYRVDPATVSKQVIRSIEALVAGSPNRNADSWITPEVVAGASIAAVA